jgi:hypothetical protein
MSNTTKIDNHYHRRMIEDGEEWKTFINIPAQVIAENSDDQELGRIVREMLMKKIKQTDEHINYIKNISNATN